MDSFITRNALATARAVTTAGFAGLANAQDDASSEAVDGNLRFANLFK